MVVAVEMLLLSVVVELVRSSPGVRVVDWVGGDFEVGDCFVDGSVESAVVSLSWLVVVASVVVG